MQADAGLAHDSEARHGIFTRSHALAAGLTDAHIEQHLTTGAWQPVFHSAYRVTGAPTTWQGTLLAACWAGGFRAVASHRSAAALYELAGSREQVAEITCPRWRRARHPGVEVHETKALDPIDMTVVDGIPVTTAERTLFDLGAVCSPLVVRIGVRQGAPDRTRHIRVDGASPSAPGSPRPAGIAHPTDGARIA